MNLFDEWNEVKAELLSRINPTPAPTHGGYPNGVVTNNGGVTIGSATYTITNMGAGGAYVNVSPAKASAKPKTQSSDLPAITLDAYDEAYNQVTMTLRPEASISVSDLNRLMMLCMAYANAPDEFSALAYVKKHNLERHFAFS